jgi:cytochrome c2
MTGDCRFESLAPRYAGILALVLLAACGPSDRSDLVPGGSPARGRTALGEVGCGSCHQIPGVRGPQGKVGPPLDGIAERTMLAGRAPNTPGNMVSWIRNPQMIEPGTAMPNLHVDERTARDMAAYLYTLR